MASPTPRRTFGRVRLGQSAWVLDEIEPQVCIKLKSIFPQIPKHLPQPFLMPTSPEVSNELEWFMQRYPLRIAESERERLAASAAAYRHLQNELAVLFTEGFKPQKFELNGELRDYQARAVELFLRVKRLLVGDSVGLGKTLVAIGALTNPQTLPALVVMQAHLPTQWQREVARFLGTNAHIIKTGKPYTLPAAKVYLCSYSKLAGWVDIFTSGFLKSVVFDECQELRRCESQKYQAADGISKKVEFAMGLSATPVYNYGNEIWNICDLLKAGALGSSSDFNREWCGYGGQVKEPAALGAYLREINIMIRRTPKEVGRELPAVNKIVHTVGHDQEAVDKVEDIARALALRVTTGEFTERGQAARELDMMLRQITGVSKARFVAEYVRILLENKEPVLLAGWHREVYDIWNEELAEFRPVMFTGSESPKAKNEARDAFVNGQTDLMFISLRSGIGLDGLQKRCSYVVFGELDWSPGVHEQVTGRLHRDCQANQVTAIYLVSEGGSDPLLVDLLGLKASQAKGIIDPFLPNANVHSDDSRIKALAKYVLEKRGQGQLQLRQG